MATVTNTIKLPDGSAPSYAAVVIELVASTTSRAAGWITANDTTILSVARPTVTAGAWTASLTPNADITPSGTVYKVTETADKVRYIHYIEVDSDGGSVHDLLVDAPASLPTAALTDHINDAAGAHAASAISVLDSGGNYAGATVEAVLTEVAATLDTIPIPATVEPWNAADAYSYGALVAHKAAVWEAKAAATVTTTTRTNQLTNPRFHANRTGWTMSANATGTVVDADRLEIVTTGSFTTGQSLLLLTSRITVAAGEVWSGSFKVHNPSNAAGTISLRAAFSVWDPIQSLTGSTVAVAPGETQIIKIEGQTIPSGKTELTINLQAAGSIPSGRTFYVHEALLEEAATAGDWFCGASADTALLANAWTGTADASTSTQTVTATTLGEPGDGANWVRVADAAAPLRKELATTFTPTIDADNVSVYPTWMDPKYRIEMLSYGGPTLYYSRNDGDSWTSAEAFTDPIVAARHMDNGEVIVCTKPSGSSDPHDIWVSSGWQASPASATWTNTHTGSTDGASPAGAWSWSVHGPIVLIADYGPKLSTGGVLDPASELWMSVDYGLTWTMIYDLEDLSTLGSQTDYHLHGVCYDPYWDRIWLCYGDGISGIIYSDDLGATWQTAQSTTDPTGDYQVVNIVALPNCVLFGTDGQPNGILRIDRARGKSAGAYPIEIAYRLDEVNDLTYLCYGIWRGERPGDDAPAVFYFRPHNVVSGRACVITTVDGWTFNKVWEDDEDTTGGSSTGNAFGPTARGNLLIYASDGRYGSGRTRWRGPMAGAY